MVTACLILIATSNHLQRKLDFLFIFFSSKSTVEITIHTIRIQDIFSSHVGPMVLTKQMTRIFLFYRIIDCLHLDSGLNYIIGLL